MSDGMQLTAAGAQARSIMRAAWQDPEDAVAALEKVNELAAAAPAGSAELREIQDAATMLSRLAGTLNSGNAISGPILSAQLSMVSSQVDLAALHGHHIPGTAYTYRHDWLPLIGKQIRDPYPQWKIDEDNRKLERKAAREEISRHPEETVTSAQKRVLTSEQRAMVQAHYDQQARAARAAARAQSRATPRAGMAAQSPSSQALRAQSTPQYAETGAEAAPKSVAGITAAGGDHALAGLAAPGADMAALKSYIDARVAAEVARQVGQITAQQQEDIQKKLAGMHKAQQKLIAHMRSAVKNDNEQEAHTTRTHLVMNNLFAMAGVGVALGGISMGLAPVAAAIAAGIVPLVNVIHDYARNVS
jgi:hypothetical protein